MARLLRAQQPRLYDWLFQLRDKRKTASQLNLSSHHPVVHTTRMYPAQNGCASLVMPLITEPGNSNSVLVYDLRHDPEAFLSLDSADLHQLLFTRQDALPEGTQRLPVKAIKTNKCPALAPRNTLDDETAERIGMDLHSCHRNWQTLLAHPDFFERVATAYSSQTFEPAGDVDSALYDGFFDQTDQYYSAQVRRASPQDLATSCFDFHDSRLPELLFRYRARNWPETLTTDESERWQQHCIARLTQPEGIHMTVHRFTSEIARLRESAPVRPQAAEILDALEAWGKSILSA